MKKYIEYAVVIAVAFLLSYVFIKPVQNIVNNLGAQSVNILEGNCLTVEGVQRCVTRQGFSGASTTLCSIKAPSATSTLVRGGLTIASTSATITYMEWFKTKNATGGATSTIIASTQWAANAWVSTTTDARNTAINLSNNIFAPDDYLSIRVVNAAFAQLGGNCQAVFETLR